MSSELLETEYILSKYQEIRAISESDKNNIILVMESRTNKLYVKKVFPKSISLDAYKQLKDANFKDVPQIHYILAGDTNNYVIEEYVSGASLEAMIGNGNKFSISQVILWITALCRILRKLHNKRPPIIHRDIKPANIIITDNSGLKLIDFDISRVYKDESVKDTRPLGTDYYAAPEQFGFAQTDNRTDIYALGKLMIVLLTGKQQMPDTCLDDLGYLKPIIGKCCAFDPAHRYQNVTELLRVLQLTIFDGLEKLPSEDIAVQIAILETMNMATISKTYADKTGKNLVSAANFVGNLLNMKKVKEPKVKDIWERIDEKATALRRLPRKDLDDRLFAVLTKKAGGFNNDERTPDMVSARVIDEAGRLFDIPDNLTSAQKADCIFNRYSERMIENIQKELMKQSGSEATKTDETLQANIDEMNDTQREDLRKILNVEKLTAQTVRNALLKAGAPAAILTGVSATGFGAYMALTTIIHAIATTALGITLPFAVYTSATTFMSVLLGPLGFLLIFGLASFQIFSGSKKLDRELMAQIVWVSVSAYGSKFALEDDYYQNEKAGLNAK